MALLMLLISHIFSSAQADIPFGTSLGQNGITIGYSNSNDSYISNEYNYLGSVFTGKKWQCVEYARRWLILEKGLTFVDVPGAADIWKLNNLEVVETGEKIKLKGIENGSECLPIVGNILIYKRGGSDMPYGHVAIITEVNKFGVKIAEQNWDSEYWPGDYSREINFTVKDQKYYLIDSEYPMNGWMEYAGTLSGCKNEDSYGVKGAVLCFSVLVIVLF